MYFRKIPVGGGRQDSSISKLYEVLKENGIDSYLNEDEGDEFTLFGSSTLIFRKKTRNFLTIDLDSSLYRVRLYGQNNTIVCKPLGGNDGDRITNVYVSDYGIAIEFSYSKTTDRPSGEAVLIITKDNEGETVVICSEDLKYNSTSTIYICSPRTGTLIGRKLSCSASTNYGTTSICQLPVCDTVGNYTPYVYLLAYSQTSQPGILEINGIKYYSNGMYCLRIE